MNEAKLMGDGAREWVEYELKLHPPHDDFTRDVITDIAFRAFLKGWVGARHAFPTPTPRHE